MLKVDNIILLWRVVVPNKVIVYVMSDREIDRVISSFIKEKVYLACMIQSLSAKNFYNKFM